MFMVTINMWPHPLILPLQSVAKTHTILSFDPQYSVTEMHGLLKINVSEKEVKVPLQFLIE
jgi:hypothetical protein